jgi:hypothetical protein
VTEFVIIYKGLSFLSSLWLNFDRMREQQPLHRVSTVFASTHGSEWQDVWQFYATEFCKRANKLLNESINGSRDVFGQLENGFAILSVLIDHKRIID